MHGGGITQGNAARRQVALTFDDGPHPRWTPELLDRLEQSGLVGTFFVVGSSVAQFPDVVRETHRRGHEVGSHLYWHRRPVSENRDSLREEIRRSCRELEDLLGRPVRFLRFPYADRGGLTSADIRSECGLQLIHWTFSSHDSRARAGSEIVRRVAARVRPGAIVLLHDCLADDGPGLPARYNPDRSVMLASVPQLAQLLADQHLNSATLSQLIGSSGN